MSAAPAPSVTFYKEVLPVLQKDCQSCHRPGEAAPMSFLTYESTRPWAKAIKAAVLSKNMPPWFADPHVGKFANDRTLGKSEIETLVSWVEAGAPAGNPADAPKATDWVQGWRIGKPDMIISMPQPFAIPAKGTVDYQYVILPTGFTEDKYVQMAEARPGDPSVVHHILAFISEPNNPAMRGAPRGVAFVPKELAQRARQQQAPGTRPEGAPQRARQQGGGGGLLELGDVLAGYAPGTLPNVLRPGQAKLIPAGAEIILQIHYTASGKAATDLSQIGLIFTAAKPTERVLTLAATTSDFMIPAGDPNYQVDSSLKLQDDATLINMLPHMHFRGKDFQYRVTYPSGEKETLLNVPRYDFNWQLTYDLAQPKLLPKGTLIECTAHYDNSANNKYNPDPSVAVPPGEQTWEEMMFGFFDVSVPVNKTAMDLMVPADKRPRRQAAPALE
ncbi:MAG TPA: hypothetical protein VG273_01880 [Bryobacteraceae bacterium]|jgi:hypothetical protein|nr:hypothetical protein [Bryobacteraceae bacterium]